MTRFRCPRCDTPLPVGVGRVACSACGVDVQIPATPPSSLGSSSLVLMVVVSALLFLVVGTAVITYWVVNPKSDTPVVTPSRPNLPRAKELNAPIDPISPEKIVTRPGPEMLLDFSKKRPEPGFLPPDARSIVSVRAADLWETPAVQKAWASLSPRIQAQAIELNRSLGMKMIDYERVTAVVHDKGTWLVLKTFAPLDSERLKVMLNGAARGLEWKPETHQGVTYFVSSRSGFDERDDPLTLFPASAQLFVAGNRSSVRGAIIAQAEGLKEGPLAFAAPVVESGKSQLVIATSPDPVGLLPGAFAKTAAVLIEGKQTPEKRLLATARFPNAVGEKEEGIFGGLSKIGSGLLGAVKPGSVIGDSLEKTTGIQFKPVPGGATLEGTLDADKIAQMIGDIFGKIKWDGLETLATFGVMREISAALVRFHEINGHYPQAVYTSPEGKHLYSWRVEILPYLGIEGRELYDKFDRTKGWNEGPNKALTARMFPAYAHPAFPPEKAENKTVFVLPVGSKAVFDATRKPKMVDLGKATASTVLLFVKRGGVPWAAPADVTMPMTPDAAEAIIPGLGLQPEGGIEALLFDGSPRMLPRKLTGRQLLDVVDPRSGAALPSS